MTATASELVIKKGRKFDPVLAGARDVFLRDGYEGASVDQIARAAGVSKATLYSYFPDKRVLFLEVAKTECRRQADHAMAEMDTSRPPREVMTFAATHMLGFFLSDFGQQVYRTIVAEAGRFPELGRDFYENVHIRVRGTLADYFRKAMERGELSIDDPDFAAEQFPELCKSSKARSTCSSRDTASATARAGQSTLRTINWFPSLRVSNRFSSRTRSLSLLLP